MSHSFLEVIFLGTGASLGVPIVGCKCSVCSSTNLYDKRTRNAIFLRTNFVNVLIDTPPDLRFQCLRQNINRIDAVCITHAHSDHIMGFDDLRPFCQIIQKPIPLFCSPLCMQNLKQIFKYVFENKINNNEYLRVDPHEVLVSFSIGDLDFTPVVIPHGKTLSTGFLIFFQGRKVIGYFTDCSDLPESVIQQSLGVECLIIDVLRERTHPNHMNFNQGIQYAKKIQSEKTYFVHLCHDVLHDQKQSELENNFYLAYDGLKIQFA